MMSSNAEGRLDGRVALVTGGGSGIGRAIALTFAREGAHVAIVDLSHATAERVSSEILSSSGRAIPLGADVTVGAEVAHAVAETVDTFGRLDIVVNNAGIARRASILETSEEEWDRVIAVNLRSVYLVSRCALPYLLARRQGVILNLGSGWGLMGGPNAAAYCASKGAVVNLTRAMAIDHGPAGVRVCCICPGDTDTAMLRGEAHELGEPLDAFLHQAASRPLGRVGRPEEIAQAALYLASDAASFVTGAILAVDGGGTAG
jgi:NAD(P)-dependent dehydrogenase (short-subunit alcohol dehydrogenase family)